MSNTTTTEKTFVDGLWLREKVFDNGDAILKVSVLVPKFAEFVKKNKKPDGYLNIVIAKRRNPDEKNTHYAYLDTFQPKSQQNAPVSASKTVKKAKPASIEVEVDSDDIL